MIYHKPCKIQCRDLSYEVFDRRSQAFLQTIKIVGLIVYRNIIVSFFINTRLCCLKKSMLPFILTCILFSWSPFTLLIVLSSSLLSSYILFRLHWSLGLAWSSKELYCRDAWFWFRTAIYFINFSCIGVDYYYCQFC